MTYFNYVTKSETKRFLYYVDSYKRYKYMLYFIS